MSKEQKQRVASIDIGTNSVLLLVADWDGRRLTPVVERARITRLGETYVQDGRIPEAAMQRTLAVLKDYLAEARSAGAQQVWCTGTQIFRKAQNAAAFVRQVKETLGIPLEILSREQEALFTFVGALDTVPDSAGPFWAIDIGGGSTEVVLGTRTAVQYLHSFPVGGVQLKMHFHLGEQFSETDIATLRRYIRDHVTRHLPSARGVAIGIGGTPTSLAALHQQLVHYAFEKIDGYRLSREALQTLFRQMNALPLAEREKLPGMEKGRADIILAATLLLEEFLSATNNEELVVSARGLRYGVALWKLGVVAPEQMLAAQFNKHETKETSP